jgi:hypothetical protein
MRVLIGLVVTFLAGLGWHLWGSRRNAPDDAGVVSEEWLARKRTEANHGQYH